MTEQTPNTDPNNGDNNGTDEQPSYSTTADLQQQAAEALRLFSVLQDNTASQIKRNNDVFSMKMFLRVDISGAHSSVYLRPKPEIVIGRRDPNSNTVPDLDLSPYGAYQMGVSRRHAIIRWKDDMLNLYDLGGRNGTYVNGKKATTDHPIRLSDGDEVRIGKLTLRLYFNDTGE